MSLIMRGAEPFFIQRGPIGALLIHGFTGTPKEMRPLGDALAAAGLTVLGVRLPQHGTASQDMAHAHWRDWYAAVLDGWHLLRGQCETVFVMGLSMGGALALLLSAEQPVAGVVTLSTPGLLFHDQMPWLTRFASLVSLFRPHIVKGPSHTTDPDMRARRVAYDVFPVRGLPHFRAVLRQAHAALPRLTAPALLVHSRGDYTIPPENMPHIFGRLGGADKAMFWLERSDHVITEEVEREQLFARVLEFVRAHADVRAPEAA
jgi:carboxylesterase